MQRRRPSTSIGVGLAVFAALVAVAVIATTAGAGTTWTVYHGSRTHKGDDTSEPALLPSHTAWKATLDQAVYGQPLVFAGRVFAVTENDTVYALDAHNGHVLWHVHLGAPLTNVVSQAGCGNIDPLGITSTPVIDTSRHELFVVGEFQGAPGVALHQLFGIDVYTGKRLFSVNADPGHGQNPVNIQQRAGLAIGNGRVYIGYGGLAGDCGPYHGWLVSLTEAGTKKVVFDATPHTGLGAIWAPPGPSVNAAGDVYVATGNPNAVPSTHDYGESVVKLDPMLHVLAHFSGSNATDDEDLGSVSPVLLPSNLLFQVGKQNVGYLLDSRNLAKLQSVTVCADQARGGTAFDGSRLFVNCSSHVQAIDIHASKRTMSRGWRGPAVSIAGPPVIADRIVWSVDYGTGKLYALNEVSGAVRATITLGSVPHFASPTTALGLVLVGTTAGVTALAGPGGPPPPAPKPPK